MKKRNGFVSNSSSSSFIIISEKPLNKIEDLNDLCNDVTFGYGEDERIVTSLDFSQYIYENMIHTEKLSMAFLIKEFNIDVEDLRYKLFLNQYISMNVLGYQKYLNEFKEYTNNYDKYTEDFDKLIEPYMDDDIDDDDWDELYDHIDNQLIPSYPALEFYNEVVYDEYTIPKINRLTREAFNIYFKDILGNIPPRYLYTFEAEGSGNGWVSHECNAIHELPLSTVFKSDNVKRNY